MTGRGDHTDGPMAPGTLHRLCRGLWLYASGDAEAFDRTGFVDRETLVMVISHRAESTHVLTSGGIGYLWCNDRDYEALT